MSEVPGPHVDAQPDFQSKLQLIQDEMQMTHYSQEASRRSEIVKSEPNHSRICSRRQVDQSMDIDVQNANANSFSFQIKNEQETIIDLNDKPLMEEPTLERLKKYEPHSAHMSDKSHTDEVDVMTNFKSTLYTATSMKERAFIFQWYQANLLVYSVRAPSVILNVLKQDYKELDMVAVLEILQTAFYFLDIYLFFILRKNLKFLLEGLIIANIMLFISSLKWSIATQTQPDVEGRSIQDVLDELDIVHSGHIAMAYNIMPPILMNTVVAAYLIEKKRNKIIFFAVTLALMIGIILYQVAPKMLSQSDSAFTLVALVVLQFATFSIFAKVMQQMDDEKFRFMLEQNQKNQQFKRIINAVDDAMIIISGSASKEVTFQNMSAIDLFSQEEETELSSSNELLDRKQFFCFQRRGNDDREKYDQGISLTDLISKNVILSKQQVYTRHKDIGLCTSMAQDQLITKLQEQKKADRNAKGFDFFMIRLIHLQRIGDEEKSIAIQLVDISEKIFNDCLSTESKYLTFINATISHEMRNPLNSMTAQLANQTRIMRLVEKEELDSDQLSELLNELHLSQEVTNQSAKLMDFNVENIVSLPKLKDKTFQKNMSYDSLDEVVNEIKWITSWTAKQRNITVETAFPGLKASERSFTFDKRRFQQVLLNYLSNAIKFIDKEAGHIKILIQIVSSQAGESHCKWTFEQEVRKFYGYNFIQQGRLGHMDSQMNLKEADTIFCQDENPKLVLSVFDNGVGIEEAAQKRLYELFSGLQQSKEVEAKGIGLGVVVSNLISHEFGGASKMYSQLGIGSIFQSAFELPPGYQTNMDFEKYLNEGLPDTQKIKSLPQSQHLDFIQFFLGRQNKRQVEDCVRMIKSGISDNGVKRILIVDDEPYNCLALYTLLKSLELKEVASRVDLCMSGKDAIKSVFHNIRSVNENPKGSQGSMPGFSQGDPPEMFEIHQSLGESQVVELLRESVSLNQVPDLRSEGSIFKTDAVKVCDYGLILTDCSMPFMDGYECTKCIRTLLQASGITHLEDQPRIVAITGHFEPEYQMKAICSGMEKVYPKPMTQEVLSKLLLESGFEFKIPKSVSTCLPLNS